jgi:hypothetical protein
VSLSAPPLFTGMASYYDSMPGAPTPDPRVYLRLGLPGPDIEFLAMVDTAAPWCILKPHLAVLMEGHLEELGEEAVLSTRLGRFSGRLCRGTTTLLAEEGEEFDVDTTFFLSPDWPGGNFAGYQGFLERLVFAVDSGKNYFYFGSL